MQLCKRATEIFKNVARQNGLLALAFLENRNLGRTPTGPCADSSRVVKRQPLPNQCGTNTGENIAHSASRHSRIAGGIVAEWPFAFGHDRARAFVEERDGKCFGEILRGSCTRHLSGIEQPFHFTGMRRDQPRTGAAFQNLHVVRNDVLSVRVEHHGGGRALDNFQQILRIRFSQTRSERPDIHFFLEQVAIRTD